MVYSQVIQIHPQAPAKPAEGSTCNGCGVCCLAQPCPLGMVLSKSRSGPCTALRWQPDHGRYACGAIIEPHGVLPWWLQWRGSPAAVWLPRLARRWIAAGLGCDSDLEPQAHHQRQ